MQTGALSMSSIPFKIAIVIALSLSVGSAKAEGLTEAEYSALSGRSESAHHFVEFRARSSSVSDKTVGHAWVAVGSTLPNGTTVVSRVTGFYPEAGTGVIQQISHPLSSQGQLQYGLHDMKFDTAFRVGVTKAQASRVELALNYWAGTTYQLTDQNCVDLARDVATTIGLTVGDESWPVAFVEGLAQRNDQGSAYRAEMAQREAYVESLGAQQRSLYKIKTGDELKAIQKQIRMAIQSDRVGRQSDARLGDDGSITGTRPADVPVPLVPALALSTPEPSPPVSAERSQPPPQQSEPPAVILP